MHLERFDRACKGGQVGWERRVQEAQPYVMYGEHRRPEMARPAQPPPFHAWENRSRPAMGAMQGEVFPYKETPLRVQMTCRLNSTFRIATRRYASTARRSRDFGSRAISLHAIFVCKRICTLQDAGTAIARPPRPARCATCSCAYPALHTGPEPACRRLCKRVYAQD